MLTRRTVLSMLPATGLALAAAPAFAQTYPDRPIKLIVPFPPRRPDGYDGAPGRAKPQRRAQAAGDHREPRRRRRRARLEGGRNRRARRLYAPLGLVRYAVDPAGAQSQPRLRPESVRASRAGLAPAACDG